jgi:Rps23 Pro-64 3,4-dihydroxylase Tpa1-like proline 4-hydroxylase
MEKINNFKLDEIINPKYLEKKQIINLKNKFKENKPFPHLSLNEFLKKDYCEFILKEILKEEYFEKDCDLYKFKRTYDFKHSKNNNIKNLIEILINEFRIYIEEITNLKLNNKQIFIHSLMLENGDYLLCHDDIVENRIIAFIFNLSKNWTKEDGGELELFYSKKDEFNEIEPIPNKTVEIIPKFGQLNFFQVSEKSFHQIKEVLKDKKRITIGGWFLKE